MDNLSNIKVKDASYAMLPYNENYMVASDYIHSQKVDINTSWELAQIFFTRSKSQHQDQSSRTLKAMLHNLMWYWVTRSFSKG